jgi:hypothetical protein
MVLVTPVDLDTFPNVTLPQMNWSIESVANHQPADCSNLGAPEWIDTGAGTIEFGMLGMFDVFPCELDIDIVFDVMGDPPTLDFQVMNLPVAGC